jgi:hypothetical protein
MCKKKEVATICGNPKIKFRQHYQTHLPKFEINLLSAIKIKHTIKREVKK